MRAENMLILPLSLPLGRSLWKTLISPRCCVKQRITEASGKNVCLAFQNELLNCFSIMGQAGNGVVEFLLFRFARVSSVKAVITSKAR